jgi:hypothetical protein
MSLQVIDAEIRDNMIARAQLPRVLRHFPRPEGSSRGGIATISGLRSRTATFAGPPPAPIVCREEGRGQEPNLHVHPFPADPPGRGTRSDPTHSSVTRAEAIPPDANGLTRRACLQARYLPLIRIDRPKTAVRRREAPKDRPPGAARRRSPPSDRSIGPVRGVRRASAVAGRLGRAGRQTDGLGSPSRRIGRESLGDGEPGLETGSHPRGFRSSFPWCGTQGRDWPPAAGRDAVGRASRATRRMA